jgi:hypothetical protein
MTILFAGVMCGIGGAFYSIGYLGMFTTTIIGGRGWIAFAICFLGNWKPLGVLAGTLVFGWPKRSPSSCSRVVRVCSERVVHCHALHPDHRADRRSTVVQYSSISGCSVPKGRVAHPTTHPTSSQRQGGDGSAPALLRLGE